MLQMCVKAADHLFDTLLKCRTYILYNRSVNTLIKFDCEAEKCLVFLTDFI